jgi:hypothetical protein
MIDVIWWQQSRGNWDSGLLCSIFEKHTDCFKQINEKEVEPRKRAIVIVCGKPDPQPLREYLLKMDSGLVILTSEEDSFFNWQYAIPDYLEIWTQYYAPNKQDIETRLLLGFPNRLKDYKIEQNLSKKYLWSFVGQVQNPFREKCVEVLKNIPRHLDNGLLYQVEGFGGQGNGLEYQTYLNICSQSKYVICPAGSMCVDSFRVYEAIKCGAIPITDRRCPRDSEDFDYWKECYPNHGLITVGDWSELPRVLERPVNSVTANLWWNIYENNLTHKLIKIANRDAAY